jgi:hypothetical protein
MNKISTLVLGLTLCTAATANAAMVFVDAAGNGIAPGVIDASKDAIYFTESLDEFGNGQYTVTNNTTSYGLLAFGISNIDTQAGIGTSGGTFGCGSNPDTGSNWCYEASNLDTFNWNVTTIDFSGNTGFDIYGDISNVLDAGDNTLNFYMAADGDLQSGDSWDQFFFGQGILASQLFVVLESASGTVYGSGGQPVSAVPVPAAAWLMLSGLVGLVGVARRRSKA